MSHLSTHRPKWIAKLVQVERKSKVYFDFSETQPNLGRQANVSPSTMGKFLQMLKNN